MNKEIFGIDLENWTEIRATPAGWAQLKNKPRIKRFSNLTDLEKYWRENHPDRNGNKKGRS